MLASGVFVVIPSYNEEQHLPTLLPQIARVVAATGHPLKMFVIDDGSRDQTKNVAVKLAETLPIQVISHPTNLGVGRVFLTGLRAAVEVAAASDIIILMEADHTNDPELLPEFIRRIDAGDDVVIGSRYVAGGRYKKFPFKRLLLSLGANASMRLLFPIPHARDYTIFYRAYRAAVLAKSFEILGDNLIMTRTFVCNAELLIKLDHLQRLRISETPLVYRYDLKRGKSKMPILKTIREYFAFVSQVKRTLRGVTSASRKGDCVIEPKPTKSG